MLRLFASAGPSIAPRTSYQANRATLLGPDTIANFQQIDIQRTLNIGLHRIWHNSHEAQVPCGHVFVCIVASGPLPMLFNLVLRAPIGRIPVPQCSTKLALDREDAVFNRSENRLWLNELDIDL